MTSKERLMLNHDDYYCHITKQEKKKLKWIKMCNFVHEKSCCAWKSKVMEVTQKKSTWNNESLCCIE